ncbi:low molecular weight phosphotyrosine protein phosphatase [Formicincola oecophyllae]|uniref:protein-tyrosine-phosphatase n=2 Tax=Formicincola oecophyllae TaxID=2558361 RepID=A0A4Y6UC34_9PROT|nr:low molecular weight phosphotyrosine protein phosphatase [Formicincola oecophyllae]
MPQGPTGALFPQQPAVLFVCTGNICRSPMGEGILRAEAAKRGLSTEGPQAVRVDSAAIAHWNLGDAPDQRAQAQMAAMGCDISAHRARMVRVGDFRRFTHIIAMDHSHLKHLLAMRPHDSIADISLMLDHVPGQAGQAVADPYYGTTADFAAARDLITQGCAHLAAKLWPQAGQADQGGGRATTTTPQGRTAPNAKEQHHG